MKKVKYMIMVIAGLMVTVQAMAQSSNQVPSAVMDAFRTAFPAANNVEWDREGQHYEVDFEVNRLDHEAWFNGEGKMVRHKQEMRNRDLPEQVKNGVKRNHKRYRITDVEKLTIGNEVVYKLELSRFFRDIDVVVNEQGETVTGFIW